MSTPDSAVPQPTSAFRSDYLDLLRRHDEHFFSAEGESMGPWLLRQEGEGHALYRLWEGREHGDRPEAVFRHRDVGLLFLAAWPAAGRDPVFQSGERSPEGHQIHSGTAVVGHLRTFSAELLQAAHVLTVVARSPLALAALFEAAGPVVQEKVGQILGRRMGADEPE